MIELISALVSRALSLSLSRLSLSSPPREGTREGTRGHWGRGDRIRVRVGNRARDRRSGKVRVGVKVKGSIKGGVE